MGSNANLDIEAAVVIAVIELAIIAALAATRVSIIPSAS
jgi:hypothetical protein